MNRAIINQLRLWSNDSLKFNKVAQGTVNMNTKTINKNNNKRILVYHKKEYLLDEHPDNIPVMKSIKRTLDINNIMNPGKIFDLN